MAEYLSKQNKDEKICHVIDFLKKYFLMKMLEITLIQVMKAIEVLGSGGKKSINHMKSRYTTSQ